MAEVTLPGGAPGHLGPDGMGSLGLVNQSEAGLSTSAQTTLSRLLGLGPSTRPALAVAGSLSKQTVSLAVAELERAGLVRGIGRIQGEMGRTAQVFAISERSGWMLGLDVGGTHVHALAVSLDGSVLQEERSNVSERLALHSRNLTAKAIKIAGGLRESLRGDHGEIRAAAVALPFAVPSRTQADQVWGRLFSHEALADLTQGLVTEHRGPVLFENNVNCAALAEGAYGGARGHANYIYLQIGVGIGAAIVTDGRLVRGAAGAAGEVARFPFPFDPGRRPRRRELEKYLSTDGIVQRARRAWRGSIDRADVTPVEIFQEAERGNRVARALVQDEGVSIGRLAGAVAAVVDPDLVLLGGGVGSNKALLPVVEATLRQLDLTVEVAVGGRGDRATVEGAALLARQAALQELLGSRWVEIAQYGLEDVHGISVLSS